MSLYYRWITQRAPHESTQDQHITVDATLLRGHAKPLVARWGDERSLPKRVMLVHHLEADAK